MAYRVQFYVRDQSQFSCDEGELRIDGNVISVWRTMDSTSYSPVFVYALPEGNYAKFNEITGGVEVRVNE